MGVYLSFPPFIFPRKKWERITRSDGSHLMCLLSKRFPELLFCLHGEGESGDDLWDAYFFEGKCQHCPAVITYEDFDPSKLCVGRESAETRKGVYSYQSS